MEYGGLRPYPVPARSSTLPLKSSRTANIPRNCAMELIRKKGDVGSKEKAAQVKLTHEVVTQLVEKRYFILKSNAFMQTKAY